MGMDVDAESATKLAKAIGIVRLLSLLLRSIRFPLDVNLQSVYAGARTCPVSDEGADVLLGPCHKETLVSMRNVTYRDGPTSLRALLVPFHDFGLDAKRHASFRPTGFRGRCPAGGVLATPGRVFHRQRL